MEIKEMRGKDIAELGKQLSGLYEEQFNLRMQNATGQLGQNSEIRRVRRLIARVLTVMNEKRREAGA
ncbi:MAG: 50S ribosomal protein L29 [Gammaproteobacteria bacterium]|nr:50S ribosomal protein L29 [Gammaproteobacteria bacterium]